ncbi:MAG: TetR/AcrR family transcriptional regulator [Actinomycetota bacterium]
MTASQPRSSAGDGGQQARRRMKAPERREQLIGIARKIFAERGYEATSIEEIAERAGVSKPVVYEHFGGKEGLHAVIVDREIRSLVDRIKASLITGEPRRTVESVVQTFLTYVEDEEDGFRILVRDAPVGRDEGSLPSVLDEIADAVEALLMVELKTRGFKAKTAPVLARALVGMVALVGQWWLSEPRPRKKMVAEQVVNLAWNGLKDLDREPRSG